MPAFPSMRTVSPKRRFFIFALPFDRIEEGVGFLLDQDEIGLSGETKGAAGDDPAAAKGIAILGWDIVRSQRPIERPHRRSALSLPA